MAFWCYVQSASGPKYDISPEKVSQVGNLRGGALHGNSGVSRKRARFQQNQALTNVRRLRSRRNCCSKLLSTRASCPARTALTFLQPSRQRWMCAHDPLRTVRPANWTATLEDFEAAASLAMISCSSSVNIDSCSTAVAAWNILYDYYKAPHVLNVVPNSKTGPGSKRNVIIILNSTPHASDLEVSSGTSAALPHEELVAAKARAAWLPGLTYSARYLTIRELRIVGQRLAKSAIASHR